MGPGYLDLKSVSDILAILNLGFINWKMGILLCLEPV